MTKEKENLKHKYIFDLAMFRFGVRRFESQVNELLSQGWKVHLCPDGHEEISCKSIGIGLRVKLFAHLVKEDEVPRS